MEKKRFSHIYIYIYERERERERDTHTHKYIYTWRVKKKKKVLSFKTVKKDKKIDIKFSRGKVSLKQSQIWQVGKKERKKENKCLITWPPCQKPVSKQARKFLSIFRDRQDFSALRNRNNGFPFLAKCF